MCDPVVWAGDVLRDMPIPPGLFAVTSPKDLLPTIGDPMNTRAYLLLSASLAVAMPLKQGATWTWVVRNRATNDSTFRTATVFGSVQRDSGTAWFLQARDSVTKQMDTALILQRPNGTQSWLRGSTLLPWEPQPWNGVTGSWNLCPRCGTFPYTNDTVPMPWSEMAVYPNTGVYDGSPFLYSLQGSPPYLTANGMGLPPGIWEDTVGLLKARFQTSSGTQTDWTLGSKDGRSVAQAADSLALPDSGSSYVWAESTDSYSYGPAYVAGTHVSLVADLKRRWDILARLPDSSGWSRVQVRETITRSTVPDSGSILDIRLNRQTGAMLPAQDTVCPAPATGWWMDWADSLDPQGRSRYFVFNTSSVPWSGYSIVTKSQWGEWIQSRGINDSVSCQSSSSENNANIFSGTTVTTTRVLLSVNGVQIRQPSALAKPQATRAKGHESIATLAARYPSATIRWHDIQGRSGQFTADQLTRHGSGSGLLFLDATFPDGSRWTGSYLDGVR